MKKTASQITVAVVCAILGFLLAYQFKVLSNKETIQGNANNSDMISEIEGLKKEKEELTQSNSELTQNLKNIEDSATKEGEVEKEIKNQLDNARMQSGLVDVTGQGIVISITPKNNIFSANSSSTS
ncbi:MAG TPA: division initiation protein, partial [Clostridium sp.]